MAKIATTIAKTISNESPPDNHLRSTVENRGADSRNSFRGKVKNPDR